MFSAPGPAGSLADNEKGRSGAKKPGGPRGGLSAQADRPPWGPSGALGASSAISGGSWRESTQ